MSLEKNVCLDVEITGYTSEGNGVAHHDGMAIFVPLTAKGDRVRIKLVKVKARYAYGKLLAILEPSPYRVEVDCPVFTQCGGCAYRHMEYAETLALKDARVRDDFKRLAHFDSLPFSPILGASEVLHYRNKAQYPVQRGEGGVMLCGFYGNRSHRVIPHTHCTIQPECFGEIVNYLLGILPHYGIKAYDESTHTGELRHIYLREGYHSKDLSLTLITRRSIARKLRACLPSIIERFPKITGIIESINPDRTNVILGEECHLLWGEEYLRDTLLGLDLRIHPKAFYQVNTPMAEQLYLLAREYAGLSGGETLLDLYCGTGTIGLSMAEHVGRLLGIEVVESAVECAKDNARRNGIEAEFYCGDVGTLLPQIGVNHVDVLVLDPPRKGCDSKTLENVIAIAPKRIVMISCNPSTAARDSRILVDQGYHIEKIRAVDLFPHTTHVETVCLLSRISGT